MTAENLKEIRQAEKSISAMMLELEALRYHASGAGAIRYDKDKVQTSPGDFFSMVMSDIVEIDGRIRQTREEVDLLKTEAYSVIRRMERPEHRAVIELYYLNGLSMARAALQMNMSERSAYYLREDAIREFEKI